MWRQLFPTIAAITEDWDSGKWMAAPSVLLLVWSTIAVDLNILVHRGY